uniref:Reverse transcriptase domain-containing protein n=1 Tax=Plectus sambesii TaxID=2011161 RepID=A0A914WRV7_9BILA
MAFSKQSDKECNRFRLGPAQLHLHQGCVCCCKLQLLQQPPLLRATLDFNPPSSKCCLQPHYRHAEPQPRGQTFLNKNIYQFAINQLRDQMPLPTASLDVQYTTILEHIREAAQVASKIQPKKKRLSTNTEHLLLLCRTMKIDESARSCIEFVELCKLIRKEIREDLCIHHFNLVNNTMQNSRSLRKVRGEVATGKRRLIQLRQDDGTFYMTVEDLNKATKAFFEKLYASTADVEFHIHSPEDRCPPFLPEEVRSALMQMKTGKTPGNDHITTEMLKHGHKTLVPVLTQLFNTCLTQQATPKHMANSSTILLFKKGDPLQLKNYRPVSLLSVIYKLLKKFINNRSSTYLKSLNRPNKPAFDVISLLSTTSTHLTSSLKRLMIKANAIWSAIQEQGVHAKLINLLRNIYTNATSEAHINDERIEIDIHRDVQQGDTISLKLFTACLEQISRRLPWDDRSININGQSLSNLRFADDIVLFANTTDELQQMASELNDQASQIGLKINSSKTKAMSTTLLLNPIHLDDNEIKAINNYIYLGQLVTIVRDHTREIRRLKQAGWAIFHQYRNFLTSHTVDMKYK